MGSLLRVILVGLVSISLLVAVYLSYDYMSSGGNTGQTSERQEVHVGLLRYVDPKIIQNITDKGYRILILVNNPETLIGYYVAIFPAIGSKPIMLFTVYYGESPRLFDDIIKTFGLDYVIESSQPERLGNRYWYWEGGYSSWYQENGYPFSSFGGVMMIAGNKSNTVLIGFRKEQLEKEYAKNIIRMTLESLGHEYRWVFNEKIGELVNHIPSQEKEEFSLIVKDPGGNPPILGYGFYNNNYLTVPRHIVVDSRIADYIDYQIPKTEFFKLELLGTVFYFKVEQSNDNFVLGNTIVFMSNEEEGYKPIRLDDTHFYVDQKSMDTVDVVIDMTIENVFDKKITIKKIIIPDLDKTLNLNTVLEPGGKIHRRLRIADNIPSYEWDVWGKHMVIVIFQVEGLPIVLETSWEVGTY